MKKLWICVLLCVLSGCAAPTLYETVEDEIGAAQPIAAPCRIELNIKKPSWMQASADGMDIAYGMEEGEVHTCVLPATELSDALETLTGLSQGSVKPISVAEGTWEAAWATTAEEGIMACRTGIWEKDGYYYCVSMMKPEECADTLPTEFRALMEELVYQQY